MGAPIGGSASPRGRAALLVLVPVLAVVLAGCTQPQPTPYGTKVGDKAHPFTLTTLDNETVSLGSLTADGILVLDLMGVNCGPCRAQTRELVEWHDGYNTSGIRVLSVDLGDQIGSLGARGEEDIRDFRDEFGAQWDFALDTAELGQDYEVIAFPTLYIINGDGTIVLKETGSVKTPEDFDATVRPLME